MLLLLHAGFSLDFCLIGMIGWVTSIYLVTRGIFRFTKAENKLRLAAMALILLLICGGLNQILFAIDKMIFPFLEGKGTFIFPFGLFFGLPFLFVFDTTDLFVYEILIFLGILFNLMAMVNFACSIENKLFKK